MPRFMPKERQADCSSLGRDDSAGPTSQAAANSSAVLARMTARYSSSVVAVFLAAPSCITSPSAMTAAAEDKISSALREATSTIILKAWPSKKSPTRTLASLPHNMRAASLPRRISLSSTTSSCSSVAVCMTSTAAAAGIARETRHCQRENRAQSLAAGRDQMIGHLGYHRYLRSRARQYGRIDPLHVGGHEVVEAVDGGGRTAFKWDDNGQNNCSQRVQMQGRASIETLW